MAAPDGLFASALTVRPFDLILVILIRDYEYPVIRTKVMWIFKEINRWDTCDVSSGTLAGHQLTLKCAT